MGHQPLQLEWREGHLKTLGDHSWRLMMLVDFNVMEGPWDTDERYAMTVQGMQSLFSTHKVKPSDSPLFMELPPPPPQHFVGVGPPAGRPGLPHGGLVLRVLIGWTLA